MTMNQNDNPTTDDSLKPLDTFEQGWVEVLRQPEPADPARDAAFVSGVVDRWASETHRPVLAKIGWTPYAAAAAVMLAAVVGWAVLRGQPGETAQPGVLPAPDALVEGTDAGATQAPALTPIAERSEDERRELARSLQLGTMIAGTSDSLAKPVTGLPKTLDDTAGSLSLQGLARGLTSPIPDPALSLPPRSDSPRG